MDNALLRGAHHQWGGDAERSVGSRLITRRQSLFYLAQERPHLAAPGAVHRRASLDLPNGLLGRRGIRH